MGSNDNEVAATSGAAACEEHDQARSRACNVCGGSDFTWGQLHGRANLRFLPATWFDRSFLERMKGVGVKLVEARVCNSCGAVQLFTTEFLEEPLLRRSSSG